VLFIDWDRCSDDPDWVRGLVALLASEPSTSSTLPLALAVSEIEDWRRLATEETWHTRANRHALAADFEVSASLAGRRLRSILSPTLEPYRRLAVGEFCAKNTTRDAVAGMPGTQLLESLLSSGAILAAWRDLVDALRVGDDDAAVWSRACLKSQLTARGIDGSRHLSEVAWFVVGQESRFEVGPLPSLEMRLDRAAEALARPLPTRNCIVWLTYEGVSLDEFVATFGPVTFMEADWCLPNAIRDDGHPFAYREELRALAASGHDWDFDEHNWMPDRSRRPYVVLARVELGERSTAGAVEDAGRMVQLMLDVAYLQGGGTAWKRRSPSLLVASGEVVEQWGARGLRVVDPPDSGAHYGRNNFASALAEHAPLVGRLLATDIAADLAEAVRMLGEAGQADDSGRHPGPSRTIDQRTVLALHDAAHDHLATFGRFENAAELEKRLVKAWPMTAWRTNVMRAIQACLSERWGGDNDLARAIMVDRTYHFDVASDRRSELLDLVEDSRVKRIAARWLASIADAPTCLEMLAELEDDVALLSKRAQRVRNGILHGTPPSPEAVASVMDFSTFRVFGALWYAMQAATSNRSMRALLNDDRARRMAEHQALLQGTSLREQWRARPATAADG